MKRNSILAVGISLALLAMPAFGQHVHELYYNNVNWADTDLTSVTGGPTVLVGGIAAFYTTPNNQLHVFYASQADYHLHQLYYNGTSWSDEDLTAVTGGQTVFTVYNQISGFSLGNAQYLYFCGNDYSVHEYAYGDNGNWNWVDTALPGGGFNSPTACGVWTEGLVAFATTPNKQRHVYYMGTNDSSIHQLYFNGLTWSNENLTQTTKGKVAPGGWMSGFSRGNFQYVYFLSSVGNPLTYTAHVHEYSYVNNWVDRDLTVAANGALADTAYSNGTAAFLVPGTTQKEVYYSEFAGNGDIRYIHRITFQNNKWMDTNLSEVTGGAGPTFGNQMLGFATQGNDQLHIYLVPDDGFVHQFYYNNQTWSDEMLPSVGNVASGMAGFAIGNLQHVYYISAN